MWWSLWTTLLVQCSLTLVATGCGRQVIKRDRSSKIVGGVESYLGEFPWVISVRKYDHHHCGGVIIGQRWVLTAGHCLHDSPAANFIVRVGEHNLWHAEAASRDYEVAAVFVHHNYTRIKSGHRKSVNVNNFDIALIQTKQDIHWNEYAWPVCLPSADMELAGLEATVIGWGKQNEKSDLFSDHLRKTRVMIIGGQQCREWFQLAGRSLNISEHLLCAGYETGERDSCGGDSGGPLLVKHQAHPSRGTEHYSVVGIVSTGIGCARPLMPGIYSNVSSYINWINR